MTEPFEEEKSLREEQKRSEVISRIRVEISLKRL